MDNLDLEDLDQVSGGVNREGRTDNNHHGGQQPGGNSNNGQRGNGPGPGAPPK
jgi:hypothetical protein